MRLRYTLAGLVAGFALGLLAAALDRRQPAPPAADGVEITDLRGHSGGHPTGIPTVNLLPRGVTVGDRRMESVGAATRDTPDLVNVYFAVNGVPCRVTLEIPAGVE